ncbi:LA_3751/LA_3752 family putative glycosyltransferase [Leptospira haakeii]|uniref:Glycosyltransferase RgtA/B/C/D-like domain-containing protein n=1 Tax=Leptospira haakeii TaxID=2023198 RepID=A0ABX4PHP7_9LEPT|nr:hypothetical protein [Leptospira haakeii]PKA15309.1 hypothetical protein CH363_13885 [Leptospira haakeii]PKA18279.1 hypothetical protein CH377_18635 [Leptospira haakeii]
MFNRLLSRISSFTGKYAGFLIFGTVFLCVFLAWQYQTGIRVGDGAVKGQQLADLIHNGFPDFSCRYSGKEIDPEFRFLPLDLKKGSTMTHVYKGKCYYVFPFYYTAIQYPFAVLMGRFGSFFLSLIFGILTLRALFQISELLGLNEKSKFFFLILLLLGSAFSLFSTDLSETILAVYGVTQGIYFLLKEDKSSQSSDLVLAGGFFGFAAFFRQETILLAASISLVYAFRIFRNPKTALFPFTFGTLLIIQAVINYSVVGHPLGSRGYLQESSSYELVSQIYYLWQLVFLGNGSLGLFGAYPALAFIILWRPKSDSLTRIIYGLGIFILLSGFLTSTKFWQGVLFGPRFLITILPFLLLFLFSILEKNWEKLSKPLKITAILLISYSIVGGVVFDRLYYKFTKSIVTEQRELSDHTSKIVIYRKGSVFLPSNSFREEREVYEIDSPESFDALLEKLYEIGKTRVTVVGFEDSYPREILVPKSEHFEFKNRIFYQSPSINMETLEFSKITK